MQLGGNIRKVIFLFMFSFSFLGFAQNSYIPNETLRTQIRKDIWNDLKLKTPKKQQLMTGFVFNSNQCFGLYEKAAKKYGWKPYDLHTAAAFYSIVLRETISGNTFSEKEVKALYEKTKSNYTKNKVDFKLDANLKQKKYDALIVEGLWVGTVFELSKKNNPEIQKLAVLLLKEFENPNKDARIVEKETSEVVTVKKSRVQTPSKSNDTNNLEVSDIILRTSTKYGLNGVYVTNDVSILYTNGDIFTNPSKPLKSINVSNSKRKTPKKWRTWKKKGSILYITDFRKGKTYDWKKWFKVRSGNTNFKLLGKFNTSDGFGGATVVNASTVVFDKQGRFAWKTVKGGNTAWKPIFSKNNSAGTYKIDGYKITLKYNNGVEEAFFFGLYPKDDEHFIIGTSHFAPGKD